MGRLSLWLLGLCFRMREEKLQELKRKECFHFFGVFVCFVLFCFVFCNSGSSSGGIDMVPWAYRITYTAGAQQTQAN